MFEVSNETLNYVAAFLGIFLAISWRTLSPYFQKLEENPLMAFRWIFVVNALLAGLGTSLVLLLAFQMPNENPIRIFLIAFSIALSGNELVNNYNKGKGTKTLRYTSKSDRKQLKIQRLQNKVAKLQGANSEKKNMEEMLKSLPKEAQEEINKTIDSMVDEIIKKDPALGGMDKQVARKVTLAVLNNANKCIQDLHKLTEHQP